MPRDLEINGYTIAQFPNAPLIVALVGYVVALIADSGTAYEVGRAVFYVGITIWAYGEATEGVNGLRKALGVVALIAIVVSLARALG